MASSRGRYPPMPASHVLDTWTLSPLGPGQPSPNMPPLPGTEEARDGNFINKNPTTKAQETICSQEIVLTFSLRREGRLDHQGVAHGTLEQACPGPLISDCPGPRKALARGQLLSWLSWAHLSGSLHWLYFSPKKGKLPPRNTHFCRPFRTGPVHKLKSKGFLSRLFFWSCSVFHCQSKCFI